MLNLSAFNHNHHASRVKMVAKFIRRGIRVILLFLGMVGLMVWINISAMKPDPRVKTLKEELARKKAELERNYEIVRQ